jgi:hypothetical protein
VWLLIFLGIYKIEDYTTIRTTTISDIIIYVETQEDVFSIHFSENTVFVVMMISLLGVNLLKLLFG